MRRMAGGPLPRLRYLVIEEVGPLRWWMWRPYCWVKRRHVPHHADVYFETCVWCGKRLWSRKRDGGPNPLAESEYATLTGTPSRPVGASRGQEQR